MKRAFVDVVDGVGIAVDVEVASPHNVNLFFLA